MVGFDLSQKGIEKSLTAGVPGGTTVQAIQNQSVKNTFQGVLKSMQKNTPSAEARRLDFEKTMKAIDRMDIPAEAKLDVKLGEQHSYLQREQQRELTKTSATLNMMNAFVQALQSIKQSISQG